MGAYDEPKKRCPYCMTEMEADWVDVGVGIVQCGPYHCQICGASEIGPEMNCDTLEEFTDEEIKTGYYKNKISPYANTVNGTIVNHVTAKEMYDIGLLDEKTFKED